MPGQRKWHGHEGLEQIQTRTNLVFNDIRARCVLWLIARVGMRVFKVVVDRIKGQLAARTEHHVTPVGTELAGPLEAGSHWVVLLVVEIAVVLVMGGEATRCVNQALIGRGIATEITAVIAIAQIRRQIELSNQVRIARFHAPRSA